MSISLNLTSQNYLSKPAVITAVPFTVMLWLRASSLDTTIAWILADGTNSNRWQIYTTGGTTLEFHGEGGGTSGTATISPLDLTTGWHFCVARAISATNRRISVLTPSGAIAHAENTTSAIPASVTTEAIGHYFAPTFTWTGNIAEYCLLNADIQADGGQFSNTLLRQLAYRGPLSVPYIKKDIIEYRSFRSRTNRDLAGEVYYGRRGRQTWTNTNGPTIGPHVPLPGNYVRPSPAGNGIIAVTSTFPVDEGNATVTITGTATVGYVLTANFADDDPDGPATGITYQWKADGGDIGGATSSTYQLTSSELGAAITVQVSYTDGEGFAEVITSSATTAVQAAPTGVSTTGLALGKGVSQFTGLSKGKGLSWRTGL